MTATTMPVWLLVDYDGLGLYEIQARDEHPDRDKITDADALSVAYVEAAWGDARAKIAIKLHERDAARIAAVRERSR